VTARQANIGFEQTMAENEIDHAFNCIKLQELSNDRVD